MLTASGWSRGSCCLPSSQTPSWALQGKRRRSSPTLKTRQMQRPQACRRTARQKVNTRHWVKVCNVCPSLVSLQNLTQLASKQEVVLTLPMWPFKRARMGRRTSHRHRRAEFLLEPARIKERQKAGKLSAVTPAASCRQPQMQHLPVLESGWGRRHR